MGNPGQNGPIVRASDQQTGAKDYRRTLRWAGVVLIALAMGNASVHYRDLQLPDALLIVIAGICLCYGKLWVTRVVAFFSGFYLGAAGLSLVLTLPFVPLGLWWAMLRNPDLRWYGQGLLGLAMLGVIGWIYWKTGDPHLPRRWEEEQTDQQPRRRAWVGLTLGLLLAVGSLTQAIQTTSGPTAQRARAEAARRLGRGYRYFLSEMTIRSTPQGQRVQAGIFAYDRRDLTRLSVSWEDKELLTYPGFREWLRIVPLHPLFPIAGEQQEQESGGTDGLLADPALRALSAADGQRRALTLVASHCPTFKRMMK